MRESIKKINLTSRAALAFVFLYHGLVSKIVFLDQSERAIVDAHHLSFSTETLLIISGAFEIALAFAIFFYRKSLLPIYVSIALLAMLFIDTVLFIPGLLTQAFSPITMNIACIALCLAVIESDYSAAKV